MSEAKINEEIREMLSKEIDNRSTVILIMSKISDLELAAFDRGIKKCS